MYYRLHARIPDVCSPSVTTSSTCCPCQHHARALDTSARRTSRCTASITGPLAFDSTLTIRLHAGQEPQRQLRMSMASTGKWIGLPTQYALTYLSPVTHSNDAHRRLRVPTTLRVDEYADKGGGEVAMRAVRNEGDSGMRKKMSW
ncbi:hypothetical protein SCHPADRAFT_911224 [Schizopora paradoxa]|uniref:Uncharacterized protein n=1 Tax=Schizopora paradoxa TaxID=27342 RepID=A0A0H2R1D1_9AGAM|nr:hypothetical protein SCHPADRAFT_911224 [Schizopora paradoxa]